MFMLQASLSSHCPPPTHTYTHNPTAASAAAKSQGGPESLLIATHTRSLLVYRGSALAWAARAESQPVAVAVAEVGGVQGMVVALTDGGGLSVCYMGTDPATNSLLGTLDVSAGTWEEGRWWDGAAWHGGSWGRAYDATRQGGMRVDVC